MAPVFKKTGGVKFECTAKGCTFGHSGRETSTVADSEIRAERYRTHGYFDRIWKSKTMPRDVAYKWLAAQLGSEDEVHIGLMDKTMCEYVRALVIKSFPYLFTNGGKNV